MIRNISCSCLLLLMMSGVFTMGYADVKSSGSAPWGYKGNVVPQRWAALDSRFKLCANGRAQSPINIPKKVKLADYALSIQYRPLSATTTSTMISMENDGRSIHIDLSPEQTHAMLYFHGKPYHLMAIYFHSPSETTWHDQSYPLEMHFVHQGIDGNLLIMAVLVKGGAANTALAALLPVLPTPIVRSRFLAHGKLLLADLLPANKDYYSFMGSLTIPPCTEGVQWIVLAESITAAPSQITALRHLLGGNNARAVQPLYHRVISFSKEGD